MNEALNQTQIDEAVELSEQNAGDTTRTLVPIPTIVKDHWGLKYNHYVRVSLVNKDNAPHLAISYIGEKDYTDYRTNNIKISNNSHVALPRRLVRAFGLSGDVWWNALDKQLVGILSDYSDTHTLYEVANYYADKTIPLQNDTRKTTFTDLEHLANKSYHYTEDNPLGVTTHRGAVRHEVPDDVGLTENDELVFTLFHDGTGFIIGLIPHEDKADDPFFRYQYNPMSASPDAQKENLPSVLLDYEKDKITFHRDRNDQLYYTVPKQVACCLWLDDGYITNWLKVGDLYLAQLIPENRKLAESRAEPHTQP